MINTVLFIKKYKWANQCKDFNVISKILYLLVYDHVCDCCQMLRHSE